MESLWYKRESAALLWRLFVKGSFRVKSLTVHSIIYWYQPILKSVRCACVEAGLIFGAWAWTATSFVAVVAALDHCLNVTYVQSASLCDIDMLWVRGCPKTTFKGKSLITMSTILKRVQPFFPSFEFGFYLIRRKKNKISTFEWGTK